MLGVQTSGRLLLTVVHQSLRNKTLIINKSAFHRVISHGTIIGFWMEEKCAGEKDSK